MIEFEYLNSEVNPALANIVSPSEIVVVSSFNIDIDGGGGDIHLCTPYAMIEPIREILDAGMQSDIDDKDERWSIALKEEIKSAVVPIRVKLADKRTCLRDIVNLKAGDIIPFDMPDEHILYAADVPTLKGHLGVHRGSYALKIDGVIERCAIKN